MAFQDLDEFFSDGIDLPISGKMYHVPGVSGEDGLYAQRLVETIRRAKARGKDEPDDRDVGQLDDDDERLLYERMLGSVMGEMLADGVSWAKIGHAAMTVFFDTTQNREVAEKYWNAGGDPEALGSAGSTQNRASRRASEAAERSTRKPGSTNGTKAAKTSARKKPGSRGKKS